MAFEDGVAWVWLAGGMLPGDSPPPGSWTRFLVLTKGTGTGTMVSWS